MAPPGSQSPSRSQLSPGLPSLPRSAGFTLLEILVATVLSLILVSALLAALNGVTNAYRQGSRKIEGTTEALAAMELLRRDLAATFPGRENDPGIAGLAPAAPASTDPADRLPPATARLAGRVLLPFEANRRRGAIFDPDTGNPIPVGKSIENAIGSPNNSNHYHPNYDAIAFVTRAPLPRQSHTSIDRSIRFRRSSLAADDLLRSDGDACLAAYYVAFTKNAPLPGAPATMKLFRHFRDSGSRLNADTGGKRSQGRAYHVLAEYLNFSGHPLLEGRLDNADLPVLLTPVRHYDGRRTIHPWPPFAANAQGRLDYPSLPKPPPRRIWKGRDRTDPSSEADLYADEPIAHNVLRFKATPLRRLTDPVTGAQRMAGAREVNQAFGLNHGSPDEWPAAVTPHALRVSLLVIDDQTASLLTDRRDWVQWDSRDNLRRLVIKGSYELETLIRIGSDEL